MCMSLSRDFARLAILRAVALLLLLCVVGSTRPALSQSPRAQSARATIEFSTDETYVGLPVDIRIEVRDGGEHEPPTLPTIPGTTIDILPPATSSFMSIVNGRRSESRTTLYIFRVTPLAAGDLLIPRITVAVDGREFSSAERRITVKPAEASDELFVELLADKKNPWVGEPVTLVLHIWVRPYVDKRYSIRLDPEDMWSFIDGSSRWGVFEPVVRPPGQRPRVPSVREMSRTGPNGKAIDCYLYEIKRTVWPTRPGPIDFGDVVVRMLYPERLERSSDLLSPGFRVADRRLIASPPTPPATLARALPLEGRPANFRNAVGVFGLRVTAKPTDVSVGEPITLTLTVDDRTPGGAELPALSPPALAAQSDLGNDFRVADEPLGGEVRGDSKQFIQTIRALRDDVAAVPPVEFHYFDPIQGEYQVARSKPIALKVRAARTIDPNAIVDARGVPAGSEATTLNASAGGLLNNELDPTRLLATHRPLPVGLLAWGMLLPALLCAGVAATQLVQSRRAGDASARRRRRARRRALGRLGASGDASLLRGAMSDFIADLAGLPEGTLTGAEAAGAALRLGMSAERSDRLRELVDGCDAMAFAPAHLRGGEARRTEFEALKQACREWVASAAPLQQSAGAAAAPSDSGGSGDTTASQHVLASAPSGSRGAAR